MLLAFVLALMTALAVFAVLWPLRQSRPAQAGASDASAGDIAVYRDQLDEIGRDRDAGTIGVQEAQAAQTEVSRRLIAAAGQAGAGMAVADNPGARLRRRRITAVAALVLMPFGAGLFYLSLGSPDIPGQPLRERMAKAQNSLPAMIAQIERHLEQNPQDGRGWEVIAPVYMREGRYDDAVRADRNALKYLGEDSKRLGDLAEALTTQAGGVITGEAKSLFEKIAGRDTDDARAQFYLGLAAEQDGRKDDAAKTWQALVRRAPADAPWLPAVHEALARVGGDIPMGSGPGPTPDQMAAASEMSPADRDKMVRSMVDGLEAKLHSDGSDVEGWLRLMRARLVLGERDKAVAAAEDARRALKDAPDKLRKIDDGIKSAGLEVTP
jgi:cytochrome c-type biogenesis protein CcmH